MMLRQTLLIPCLVVMLLTGCDRNDNTGAPSDPAPGVEFLMFPNPQASLGVGDYEVIITHLAFFGPAISYTVTITHMDGTTQTSTGTLAGFLSSATIDFEQARPGGVTVTTTTSGFVSLALRHDANNRNISSAAGVSPTIELSNHHIDQLAYAQEYYKAIDPTNARSTLAGFKATNGFGATCNPNGATEFEVRFRDVKDLGYGRHMCWRGSLTAEGDIAVWVENFQVTAGSEGYGPPNLEAVVNDDRRWHVGTNAIEFSAGPNGGTRFLKFYTFNPDGTRRTLVDLDHRGGKAMPVPCISCHGGRADPLLETATTVLGGGGVMSRYPTLLDRERGDTLARMQALNVDTLDFSLSPPWRRVDQEATLKSINRLVLCTFPRFGAAAGAEDNCRRDVSIIFAGNPSSEWQATNAAMIKAWYGGNNLPNPTQSDTLYLPAGWTAGAQENIYRTVVAPNCRVCHSQRGTANQNDIDFTTYAKFSGYADRIKYHVFDKGNMPLALLKFKQFWESTAPATLAAIVPGATNGDSVLKPNRPIAKPGPDRVVLPGTAKLSAAASLNASSYSWSTTAPCSFAVGESTKIRPTLTTGVSGTSCTVQLVVSDGITSSEVASLLVVASNTILSGIKFNSAPPVATDILPSILRGAPGCFGCHCPTCGFNNMPLYYSTGVDYDGDGTTDDDSLPIPVVDDGDKHQLYLNVRARINFTDIEGSPLLRKPTGNQHCGGSPLSSAGTPGDAGRALYDRLLNWILAGAPE